MVKKRVNVFPYKFEIEKELNNKSVFMEKFSIKKVKNNLMPYGVTSLLLIIDDDVGDFICGRFLKLRSDSPAILNIINGSERDISLLDSENIEEISHFILNLKDNIIIAEYNHQAIRHFSTPLEKYLNYTFKTNSVSVDIIPNSDTFQSMQSEKEFKSIKVKLAQSSLKRKEHEVGVSIIGALKDLARGGRTMVEIKISRGRGIDTEMQRRKVIEYADSLRDDDDIKTLKI